MPTTRATSHKTSTWLSLVGQDSSGKNAAESGVAAAPAVVGSLAQIQALAIEDLAHVETILQDGVESAEFLPRDLSRKLLSAGGKRIRPFLMCLCYRSLAHVAGLSARADAASLHKLAAVGELVHTATLFHDDVLDSSPTRREMPAAHVTHGNKNAILVGDFVYAEAFYILMKNGLLEPSKRLAQTIKTIVEGELRQHQVAQARDLGLENYESIARAKTAALFAWCTETGAWSAGSPHFEAARRFGDALGYAFQMADDLIDTFEVDPVQAGELDLTQWLDSAAPLPLVLLNLHGDLETKAIWTRGLADGNPAAQRESIAQLQNRCRRPEIITEALDRVDRELESAARHLIKLDAVRGLDWALEAIWERGCEGARLSGSWAESATVPRFRRALEGSA